MPDDGSVQRVRDNLGTEPEVHEIFQVRNENTIIEEGAQSDIHTTAGHAFILGHPENGVLGIALGNDGQQVVLGNAGQVATVIKVINPNNSHRERFRFDNFKDGVNTTGTWDTSTGALILDTNEIGQSLSIYVDDENVVAATMKTISSNDSELLFELSADGGNNWESVTVNERHVFSNVGNDLRWRLTSQATGTGAGFPLTFPILFGAGAISVTLVRVDYEKELS